MRIILASFCLLTAACTQTPAEIVYRGSDSFTRETSLATLGVPTSTSNPHFDIRREPTAAAVRVDSIESSDLPPPSKM